MRKRNALRNVLSLSDEGPHESSINRSCEIGTRSRRKLWEEKRMLVEVQVHDPFAAADGGAAKENLKI